MMVMEAAKHTTCLHEEQIQGQSRAIERLDAELDYKKEKLGDLKESNRRVEEQIRILSENIANFINESNTKDYELNNRLIRIETRLDAQDKATKNNRDDFKLWLAIVGVVFTAVTFYFSYMR